MESISALTELEDLERVYQQLCVQEVRVYDSKTARLSELEHVTKLNFREATDPNTTASFPKTTCKITI